VKALARIAILKFGGTSLATDRAQEIAVARVRETLQQGSWPVVVCSAMGRAPEPYATDTLLALRASAGADANSDLLLACGELISAALFASELEREGIPARALTGAQAGILTDGSFGNARVLRVEPVRVRALIEEGRVPVVAGFQGMTAAGELTTLGRGGTDLSAIALGHALGAERIDLYTDVTGAMSADPQRVPGARTIDRAQLLEMSEFAEHGATVVHAKAAEYARATKTPYAIKNLETDRGTIVHDGAALERPVTGVTSTRDLTFVRVIRDLSGQDARMQLELQMFGRLARERISLDQININAAGIFFAVRSAQAQRVRELLADLNLAIRLREHCAKLSIVGAGMRGMPGVMYQIVEALSKARIEIVHCTDSNITISILIPEAEVARAEAAVHDRFELERGESA
jgi:aspartate kinase